MAKSKYSSGKRGFTIPEILTVIVILAISLFGSGAAIYAQFAYLHQVREKAIATLAAQEEIEAIRGMPFDNIISLGPSFTAASFTYLHDPVGTVTVDNIYGNNDLRKVSVTVSWHSFAGATSQRTVATLMTRNGINKQ